MIIELTKGYVAHVDYEDFDILSKYTWYTSVREADVRAIAEINGKTVQMSRFIVDCPGGMVVDHINGDTLDNRKCNLRICSQTLNNANVGVPRHNKSGYKGVYWKTCKQRWIAQVQFNGKKYHAGSYLNKEDAAKAYNKKAVELFGEFAKLNEV